MRHHRRLAITVLVAGVAVLGACGGGKQGETTPAMADDPVAAMVQVKDAMCACQDEACAERVGVRMNEVGETFGGSRVTDEQSAAIAAATVELDACLARLRGAPHDERVSPPDN
jgi:hypothetical protein